jgi:hypothetical protein
MTISVSARRLTLLFAGVAALLIFMHIALQSIRFWSGDDFLMGSLAAFSLGAENNFPTYFSTFSLFACSILLAAIATGEAKQGGYRPFYWALLSAIFLFLSMDEMMMIHERLTEPTKVLVGDTDVFHYAWVLPYGLFVVIFVAAFSRFLLQLPRRTAGLFILAGTLYVAGAVGFETLSGYYFSVSGDKGLNYVVLQSMEEILEISGTVLFLYALADYAERRFETMDFCLMHDATPG